jgi:hypothetical protein
VTLVSYTLPCHKREADLLAVLPTVVAAAIAAPPVEIVVVDYGCASPLRAFPAVDGVAFRLVRVEAEYFHMAHARNVGIRSASGDIVVAFLADQTVTRSFFADVRRVLQPRTFLKWEETFAFNRDEVIAAGGFDERFELYGPEGKELTDRLLRGGLQVRDFAPDTVSQIRTTNVEKVRNYRVKLTKSEMHHQGMAYWRDNQARGVTVANEGLEWGALQVPVLA